MTQFAPPQYGQPAYAPGTYLPPQPMAPQYGQPQYAPGYPPPVMAPPPAPLAQGSITDFYTQPVGGSGAFLKFEQPGVVHAGFIARAIAQGDIRQVTTPPQQGSVPQFYKDGRPKFEMLVPLKVIPSQANPDGMATWAVRGGDRDELTRAMAEAGAPEGPPEADAFVQITFTHEQKGRGGIARKVKQIVYLRPGDPTVDAFRQQVLTTPAVAPVPQQPQYAPAPIQQLPAGQYAQPTGPVQYAPQQPAYVPPAQPQAAPVAQQPVPAQVAQAPVQGAPQGAPAMPPGSESWTDQQRALYVQMTGQPAPAAS